MKRFFLIVALFWSVSVCAESHLVIEPLAGAELSYAVQCIGKIRFEDNAACLYDKQGVLLGCKPVQETRKIIFADRQDTPTETVQPSAAVIQVYPNPTQSQLIIQGLDDEQIVRIYSLQGQMLLSATATGSTATVDVNGLQVGNYILQVGAEIVKFIKQ